MQTKQKLTQIWQNIAKKKKKLEINKKEKNQKGTMINIVELLVVA